MTLGVSLKWDVVFFIIIQSNPNLSIILNELTPTDEICFHQRLLPKPELVFTHAGGRTTVSAEHVATCLL